MNVPEVTIWKNVFQFSVVSGTITFEHAQKLITIQETYYLTFDFENDTVQNELKVHWVDDPVWVEVQQ